MSNKSEDQIWQEISAEQALKRFNSNLSEAGISEIKIPSSLARELMVTDSAWQIATDPDIDPMTPYMWGFGDDLLFSSSSDYLSDDRDYFVAGHNGHGINSYGFGIVSRIGNVTVAQQQDIGGAFGDSIEDLAAVNEQIRIWNNGLWTLQELRRLPTSPLLVEFSAFRNFARISEWRERDEKWSIAIDPLESRVQAEMLLMTQDIKHPHLKASAAHLMALLQAEPRMWQSAFPEAELHASVKGFDDKTVHYLFLSTPTMYLVRKDGEWDWASDEDNEATEGDLQIAVNSKFISRFDGTQDLGIGLKVQDLSEYRVDGESFSETSFEYSSIYQSLTATDLSEVSEFVKKTNEIEVFANLLVVAKSGDSVTIAISWSMPEVRHVTGTMKIKFIDMGHAVEFLNDTLMVGLDVFEFEDLENLNSVRTKVDYIAAQQVMNYLHSQLKIEDSELWDFYKVQATDYKVLDLTEADNILDF